MFFCVLRVYLLLDQHRSPRRSCGCPRTLVVLVLDFKFRRDESLTTFVKRREGKGNQLLSAPSVGRHHSTRDDEGRILKYSGGNVEGANPNGDGGGTLDMWPPI